MGRNKVTYHHNWWAEGVTERMPRVLFGQAHVYNNYYTSKGNNYCVGVGCYASVLVENNYFKDVKDPIKFMYPDARPAYINSKGNEFVNTTGSQASGACGANAGLGTVDPFTPPYKYNLDKAKDIPTIVQNGAGPHDAT